MRKKIFALLLSFLLLFSFTSCDSSETGVVISQPVKVAVGVSSSADCLAAYNYAVYNGYELVEYETRQAAVIAVENGKADFVIINSDEATDEYLKSVELQWTENTEYKLRYCAVISKGNEALKSSVNNAINELKVNGTFGKIKDSYVKGEPYESRNASLYSDKITVLCSPVFENLLYTQADGNLAGKELDFIWEICNQLSLEAQISVVTEYDEMFSALEKGEGDIIISAVEYTPGLEKEYLLSDIYNETTFGVYKRK